MPNTALSAAVAVLLGHFKTTDGTPLQLTAIDFRHLAHQLFANRFVRTVDDRLTAGLLTADSETQLSQAARIDLLNECERILFNDNLPDIRSAKLVAACLYFHHVAEAR